MSKINTSPRGLQNLLGNINQGVNPSVLAQAVQPVVDLTRFWSTNKLETAFASGVIAGITGQSVKLSIPEGEAWLMLAASAEFQMTAPSDDTSITIGIAETATSGTVGLATNALNNHPGQTGEYQRASVCLNGSFILSGGWSLSGYVDGSLQAAARTMVVRAFYVNLKD